MKIIEPYFEIEEPFNGMEILKKIERAGRTCYKSEEKITNDSAIQFVKNIIARGHEAMLEHASITVRVVCDRGVSHEIVRHRLASYAQESTRFCNYSKNKFGNELTFIKPCFWKEGSSEYELWKSHCGLCEVTYMNLIGEGASPQEARSVLPNSLKTEIVMTMNCREWRHFFKMRDDVYAHPQMRQIAEPMHMSFRNNVPVLFD
jgi:thymidylate synthase (FAD)